MTSGYKPAAGGDDKLDSVVDELQPGTKLLHGQYTISEFLNNGGFGITYLAKDSLDRTVVIKECFPNAFCRRSATLVRARSRAHTSELKSVVKLFVNEARNLSVLQHPNIVGVHQVFEDNETAYMAIDYIDGPDLLDLIEDRGMTFTPDDIIRIARKLISAVGYIHLNNMLHRDISPDNVLIDSTGEPVLIDFGAARVQASKQSRTLTALRVVKDGYSPQEFYIAGSEQGPWSDLYALGATLYHLITGETPVNGQERLAALAEGRADPHQKLAGRIAGYPDGFLDAVDAAMNVLPKERLQSADEWLDLIAKVNVRVIEEYRHTGEAEPIPEPGDVAADALEEAVQSMVETARNQEPEVTPEPEVLADTLRAPLEDTPPARKRGGLGRSLIGLVSVAAIAGLAVEFAGPSIGIDGGLSGLLKGEAPAVTASVAAPEVQPQAAQPAQEDTAQVEPAPAPATATQSPEVVVATETTAPAAATPAEEITAAAVTQAPTPDQVSFAHWDVRLPFTSAPRRANNANIALIKEVSSSDGLTQADWLTPGAVIYSINGNALPRRGDVQALVLENMEHDGNGIARVSVSYTANGSSRFQNGELSVPVIRSVGLLNGAAVDIHAEGGAWHSVVTTAAETDLLPGDVLKSEAVTGTMLTGHGDLESILQTLASMGAPEARFDVERDGASLTVALPLTAKQDG